MNISESEKEWVDEPLYKQLPREAFSAVTFSQLVINIFGTFLLIFLLNLLSNLYFQNDVQNRGDYIVREKWRMVNTMTEPVDWLILGDSSVNQGIVPEIVDAELGGKSINLAMNASWGVVGDAWMLEAYIRRFGPPENVIIGHTHGSYWREFGVAALAQSPIQWGEWRTFSPPIELSLLQEMDIFIRRYVTLYYRQVTLREVIQQFFHSPETLFTQRSYSLQPDGYMPSFRPNPAAVERGKENQASNVVGRVRPNFASTINQQALDRVIELADEYQINVYFLNTPLYDKLYEDPRFQEYIHRMRDWLELNVSRSSQVHYITRFYLFEEDELSTVDHAYDVSAREYTHQIVDEINSLLAAQSPESENAAPQ